MLYACQAVVSYYSHSDYSLSANSLSDLTHADYWISDHSLWDYSPSESTLGLLTLRLLIIRDHTCESFKLRSLAFRSHSCVAQIARSEIIRFGITCYQITHSQLAQSGSRTHNSFPDPSCGVLSRYLPQKSCFNYYLWVLSRFFLSVLFWISLRVLSGFCLRIVVSGFCHRFILQIMFLVSVSFPLFFLQKKINIFFKSN